MLLRFFLLYCALVVEVRLDPLLLGSSECSGLQCSKHQNIANTGGSIRKTEQLCIGTDEMDPRFW